MTIKREREGADAVPAGRRQDRLDRFRHDHGSEAPAYGRLRHHGNDASGTSTPNGEAPDDSARRLMDALGITFGDGQYHLGEFRYLELADAVSHARLKRASGR